jgi:hypothetical protein
MGETKPRIKLKEPRPTKQSTIAAAWERFAYLLGSPCHRGQPDKGIRGVHAATLISNGFGGCYVRAAPPAPFLKNHRANFRCVRPGKNSNDAYDRFCSLARIRAITSRKLTLRR